MSSSHLGAPSSKTVRPCTPVAPPPAMLRPRRLAQTPQGGGPCADWCCRAPVSPHAAPAVVTSGAVPGARRAPGSRPAGKTWTGPVQANRCGESAIICLLVGLEVITCSPHLEVVHRAQQVARHRLTVHKTPPLLQRGRQRCHITREPWTLHARAGGSAPQHTWCAAKRHRPPNTSECDAHPHLQDHGRFPWYAC